MSARDIFQHYVDEQGWDQDSQIELLLRYIDNQNSTDAFEDFLLQAQEDEYMEESDGNGY